MKTLNLWYAAKPVLRGKFIAVLMLMSEKNKCHKSMTAASSLRKEKKKSELNSSRCKETSE